MATGPYGLPHGIEVDGEQVQAVPRKIGAYDSEGHVAATLSSPLTFFQNGSAFTPTLAPVLNKLYGRDTNITSRTGGMAKGERLYAYGLTAKISFGGGAAADRLSLGANQAEFANYLAYWCLSDIAINLGSDEFIRCQARDVPLWAPRPTATTNGAVTVFDLSDQGMFDLTIAGDPYVLDQQEDFRLNLNCATLPAAVSNILLWLITMKLEGVRLKSIRQ